MTAVTRIDRRLNLIVPIDGPDGSPAAYVHAMPISLESFEANAVVIARTLTRIFTGGVGDLSGPRVAAIILREEARAMGRWDGPAGVENTLINEIRRLANLVSPVDGNGWQTIPYHDALNRELLSDFEKSEVENALVFFTVVSCMQRRKDLEASLTGMTSFWDASTTSLTCTDFASSIKTSTTDADTGEREKTSSVPI